MFKLFDIVLMYYIDVDDTRSFREMIVLNTEEDINEQILERYSEDYVVTDYHLEEIELEGYKITVEKV